MSEMGPPLPQNCAGCSYFAIDDLCRRHAPSPGTEAFELVHWPKVKKVDRCGSGAAATNGEGPGITRCESCIHWFQPNGTGLTPHSRQGRSVEWWASSGYCTRFAPSPSSENDRKTSWRVTWAADGCGDGQAIEQDEDGAGSVTLTKDTTLAISLNQ